jgi:hypothetical protein
MKRVFSIDVLQCPCGGTRRPIAAIAEVAGITRTDRGAGGSKTIPIEAFSPVLDCSPKRPMLVDAFSEGLRSEQPIVQ